MGLTTTEQMGQIGHQDLGGGGGWGSSSRTLKMDIRRVCVVVRGVAEDSNAARWDTNHLFCMLASPLPRTT
ncbi:hypothetical protein Pcinc_021733 [Petrolisthes cinctipes]|uniref:Uncharacterized protein n=1 Tax=Petrolisthes cinctipes TaxID=88211 RepID=A0AAE1KHW3_PETCI|nr:hypothetical protein Pcinc_021733 [Petrolisthes cinctipes]